MGTVAFYVDAFLTSFTTMKYDLGVWSIYIHMYTLYTPVKNVLHLCMCHFRINKNKAINCRNVSVSIYLFQGLEVVHGQKLSSYDRRLIKRLCTGVDIVMRPDKLLFICTFCHQRFSQLIFRHFQNCFQAFGLGPGEFRGGFSVGNDTFEAALQERPVLFGLHDDLQEDHIPLPSPLI